MMAALAGVDPHVEVDATARAEKHRRPVGGDARAVGGDQHVGGEPILLRHGQIAQAGGAAFLARLDEQLGVEAEPSASRRHHRGEGCDVDAVLAFVVGRAASIPAIALDDERPGAEPLAPGALLAAHDVAMAVDQDGRQIGAFLALGDQERAEAGDGIVQDRARKAQLRQIGRDLLLEVGAKCAEAALVLAFGRRGEAAGEIGTEAAGGIMGGGAVDGVLAGHANSSFIGAPPAVRVECAWKGRASEPLASSTASPQGDMISVQPIFMPPWRMTPAGQAKR